MKKADWLVLGASTVVSLVLLEVVLRMCCPLFASPYQTDDVLLVKLIPGASKVFTRTAVNGGNRVVSHVNDMGFRGPELRPAADLKRVIVYGDSNVEAEFSELPATFAKQLESRLTRPSSQGVEVVNAGVVGY